MPKKLLRQGRKLVRVGRKLAIATAACIARCCGGGCPGPVLRRKCDRYCPDTNIAYGFYRIDLDAVAGFNGKTWRQWIAENDAALTPCRLLRFQFGDDPLACWVLDRNCSKCFWGAGCNYRLDIPALPVVPEAFLNPTLATCEDCIVCDDCCTSALMLSCGNQQTTCRECGSSFRSTYSGHGHSINTAYTSGPTTPPSFANSHEVTRDYSNDARFICTAANSPCTANTLQQFCESSLHVHVEVRTANHVGEFTGDETVNATCPNLDFFSPPPSSCDYMTALRTAMLELQMGNGFYQSPGIGHTIREAVLGTFPTGTAGIGDIGLGSGIYGQCSNSITTHFGGPFEGQFLNDLTVAWSYAADRNGASLTFTYSLDSYQKSDRTRPRYLVASKRAEHTLTHSLSTIDDCAPGAAFGCHDPSRRKAGDPHSPGNTPRTAGGIISG